MILIQFFALAKFIKGSPEFLEDIKRDNYRGDFIAVLNRRQVDTFLVEALRKSWVKLLGPEGNRRLKSWECGFKPNVKPSSSESWYWQIHRKSDHYRFWSPSPYSNENWPSYNAVLLFDMGVWRTSFQRCYHATCDDAHYLTSDNLSMLKTVIDALMMTLIDLGEGCCSSR